MEQSLKRPGLMLAVVAVAGWLWAGQAVSDDEKTPEAQAKVTGKVIQVKPLALDAKKAAPMLKVRPAVKMIQARPLVVTAEKPVEATKTAPAAKAEGTVVIQVEKVAEPADEATEPADEPAAAESIDIEAIQKQIEEEQKAQLKAIQEDPAWKASHTEIATIEPVAGAGGDAIHNFCLNLDGNLLVCCGGDRQVYEVDPKDPAGYQMKTIAEPSEIRVVSPGGQLMRTWKLEFTPQAIAVHTDGTIYVGGDGRLAKLNQAGRVIQMVDAPAVAAAKPKAEDAAKAAGDAAESATAKAEARAESKTVLGALLEVFGGGSSEQPQMDQEAMEAMAQAQAEAMAQCKREVNGIAITEQDVFIACPQSQGYGFAVWRTDHEFGNAVQIVDGLRGCCGQMDVQARDALRSGWQAALAVRQARPQGGGGLRRLL
jgi:hypothetical protein